MISTKLDCWTTEEIAVAEGVGNQRANLYWEGNKQNGSVLKISSSSSQNDRRNYIKEKYVRKSWVDKSLMSPYEAIMTGSIEQIYGNPTQYIRSTNTPKNEEKTMEKPKIESESKAANKVIV